MWISILDQSDCRFWPGVKRPTPPLLSLGLRIKSLRYKVDQTSQAEYRYTRARWDIRVDKANVVHCLHIRVTQKISHE